MALSRSTRLTFGAIAATAALTGAAAATPAWGDQPATPPVPTFDEVTVHDPSIVTSGDEVWIFGSHGASAYTTDLMHWTQNSIDLSQDADNPLFEDIYAELEETFAWAQTSTLWASDVIQLADGRYYLYYNACKGDSPRSALGVAVADDVDGPYEDLGILLKSGMWDEESENPGEIYDATVHPNAVDPDAFFDAEGDLWMVYGSYSGGIFILQMDPETGLPLPDQGYGTHLVGGNHARIEAPTIRYDEETGYYYLFLSYGGLGADGGYEVRVARSEKPDGPYLDANGHDMSTVAGAPGTIFDDDSIEPYGVKIMDGYLFTREVGDPGTGEGTGYVSPGHTSWYDDPATGDSYMVLHSRFPGTGEMHNVRVNRMYMNADGWPVVSPFRYAGETDRKIKRDEVVGTWQVVDLGTEVSAAPDLPVDVTLTTNGKLTGGLTGTWKLTGHDQAELITPDATYTGVFAPVWDDQRETWTVGLTVQSSEGVSLWGRQVDVLSGQAAVDAVVADLTLGDTSAVVADLDLPTTGTGETTIAWTSSDPAHVSATGDATRPGVGEDDATVTLTATIANGAAVQAVPFSVVVKARPEPSLVGAWSFEGTLADDEAALGTPWVTGDRADNTGGSVSYAPDGVDGAALHLDGTSGVRLPDGLVQGDTYSVSMWLRPEKLTGFTTAFFAASASNRWLSVVPQGWNGETMLWSNDGAGWYDGITGQLVPVGAWTHVAFTVDAGEVALYVDGTDVGANPAFTDVLTSPSATFALGVNYWDTPFQGDIDELAVWTSALSPEDVAALAAG
ncbi:family 43 glycosylhydrolase [Demequina sp. SYSU T00192]|uniref:Family 43 glycosylhydrolase n=1 Tax=Demequina litoralis TaxID=3051660 RepID=A0ABT8GCK8_9MICO|nr:LamG-like jellyroll fold domain-containing protein [Demequina sp. SYSU T00192]MDN4476707.1 family 43 glycosylhydrolase [Demequina sp. SYSU T00192]